MAVPKTQSPLQRVHFTTLGCPKNQVDTEVMARQALRTGAQITADPKDADVIVVNTCAFLQSSQEESIEAILDLSQFRKKGSCKKFIVSGCLASRHPHEIEKTLPEVDHFLGTQDLHQFQNLLDPSQKEQPVNLISEISKTKKNTAPISNDYLSERFHDGLLYSRYLKIAEGCDRTCSFCIIPQLRGSQQSRTPESLVQEAQGLVNRGAREINLIAQDLTAYGHDLNPVKRLEDLLEVLLSQVQGLAWLRLHYAYPQRISDRLLNLFSESSVLVPYLDMPLQHISNRILKAMKRGTQATYQRRLLEKIRTNIPGLTLRTTFIVGFPGETESEFQELLDYLEEIRFDHVGAFRYSPEEGTGAATLEDQLPEEIKDERWHRLMALQKEISRQKNQERIGQVTEALVLGKSSESDFLIETRARHQAPEIDGLTYLSDFEGEKEKEVAALKGGEIIRLRITQTHDYDLAGTYVGV
jgi:ribosomal protein S12 methylthiotransferase